MTRDFNVLMAVESNIDEFFDMETGRIEFNTPEFIDFITLARELTSLERDFAPVMLPRWLETGDRSFMAASSQRYMFRRVWAVNYESFGIFDENVFFTNPLPYTNRQGELLISPWRTFALNVGASQAQQALALDFLRFILEIPGWSAQDDFFLQRLYQDATGGGFASPFRGGARAMFETHMSRQYQERFDELGWRPIDNDWPQAFETMIARGVATRSMPMRDNRYGSELIHTAVIEILHQFHDGLITAEQAANDLQNRVTLIIMEMD
jgi:hypothetical protein